MVSYYNSLGSMFPASAPSSHRSQVPNPPGYFNPYAGAPGSTYPQGSAPGSGHPGGAFAPSNGGSSSSYSQQFPSVPVSAPGHNHVHDMYSGGFQGFEAANWHAPGSWPAFGGGVPESSRYEPWVESSTNKEGDFEEEVPPGAPPGLPSPPPSTSGFNNQSTPSSESPAYSGYVPFPSNNASNNNLCGNDGPMGSPPRATPPPTEDESGGAVSLPASSLSPPPLLPRPQPARSPFQWMKKPAYTNGTASEKSGKVGRTRTKDKYRVVYSDHQRLELEKEFHYSRYITIRRKAELANNVGLSERQVKIWFQNRRAKERRALKKSDDPKDPKMSPELIPGSLPFPDGNMTSSAAAAAAVNHFSHHHHPSPHFTPMKYE